MGLFSFIQNAGAKLGIGKSVEEEAAEAAAEAKAALEAAKAAAAQKMVDTVSDLCLEVENLEVAIEGDTATVTGLAKDQETKEKVVLICGNTQGIAVVDDQMEVEEVVPEATFVTVEKGDTLGKIAKEVYGNAMKYPVIFEANKPMLKSPDLIYPGQVLRCPPLEA